MLKKRKRERNNVVLSDTVPLSPSPGRATGEGRQFYFLHLSSLTPAHRMPCQISKPHALS